MPQGYSIVRGGKDTSPTLWVPADDFFAARGSPNISRTGGGIPEQDVPVYLLDPGVQETISIAFIPPRNWSTFDIDLYWTNPGTGTGDIRLVAYHESGGFQNGDAIGGDTSTASTLTAPAQDVLKVSTVASALAVTSDDRLFQLGLSRLGGDAADTLGNDVAFIGVLLKKAS